MSVEGGQPRRLTTHPAEDVAPSWSRDGRWLYFGSTRTGRFEIWKVPVGGGPSVQVTRRGGFEAYEAADGRYLYYLKGRAVPGIWRVPVNGGEESLVTDQNQAGLWRSWRIAPQGIYYATSAGPRGPRLEAFDLATGKIHLVAPMLKEPGINIPGLAVSPDGRTLLYTQRDQSGSDIMMVDGFR
jgi:Tol biopolymer transport system component